MPDLLPNLLAGVRDFLVADADVAALVSGRVHALRMPVDPTFPLVLLTDVTTSPLVADVDKLAESRLQVEAYGVDSYDEGRAWTLAATCHASLRKLATTSGFSGVLPETGLQPVPDTDLGKARWMFEVRVYGYRPRS